MKRLFILICLLFPMYVFAENVNNYSVENLYINVIDEDATLARNKALTRAQRQAFNTILNRLGIDSSNGIMISDGEISQMLRSMQIKNEKITSKSYSATLTLQFSPEYVKYILNRYHISKYSPYFNSYLIVPVLKDGKNIYLWEAQNKWLKPLTRNVKGTTGIFVVKDDYETRNLIGLDYFTKPNYNNFKKLNDLYGTNNIVVVVSEEDKKDNIIDTQIYVLNDEETVNAYLKYEMKDKNINNDYSDASIEIINYINNLLNSNEDKTAYNVIDRDDGYVNIYAPISSLKDFITVKNNLSVNKNIQEINLKMVSKKMAIFTVKYTDNMNVKALAKSLESFGFDVSEKQEGIYVFIK